MPRGRGNQNRGRGNRGQRSNRGGPRFRGGNPGRGKGRGDIPPADFSVLDYPVQVWSELDSYGDSHRRGSFSPPNRGGRGRGYRGQNRGQRGQGGSAPPSRTSTPFRGSGAFPDRGRGRGRCHAGIGSPTRQIQQQTQPRLTSNAPLSKLLYETRPLLRPISFVRSTTTPYLFQYEEEEELLKPVVEDVESEENPVPTADRVTQVFSGMALDDRESDDEELEEIDFNEIQKLSEIAAKPIKNSHKIAKTQFTGYYDPNTAAAAPPITRRGEGAADEAVTDIPASDSNIVEVAEILTIPRTCIHGLPTITMNVTARITAEEGTGHPPILEIRASNDVVNIADEVEAGIVTTLVVGGGESPSPVTYNSVLSLVESEEANEETLPSVEPQAAGFYIDTTLAPPHAIINNERDEPVMDDQALDSTEPVEDEDLNANATPTTTLTIDAYSNHDAGATAYQATDAPEAENLYIDLAPTPTPTFQRQHGTETSIDQAIESPGAKSFYIDVTPAPIATTQYQTPTPQAQMALGDDDDVIVYVAPHPRSGRATPAVVESPSTLRTSVLTGLSTINEAAQLPQTVNLPSGIDKDVAKSASTLTSRFAKAQKPRQFVSPVLLASPSTQRKAKLRVRRHEARVKKRKGKRSMFSLASARQDMDWQDLDERDPKWEERRRGDSDVDWGDEDEVEAAQESAAESGPEGMDVDPDLLDDKSMNALGSFVDAMLGQDQANFTTMDDIADNDKLHEEDEASEGGAQGSSDEDGSEEAVKAVSEGDDSDEGESGEESEDELELQKALEEEEEKMLAEEDVAFEISDEDEVDDSSDDELSPRSGFQARLERLRRHTRKSRGKASARPDTSLEDEEVDFDCNFTWEDGKGDLLQHLEELLDENQDILAGRDRKQKNQLFRAISNGDNDDLYEFTVAPRRRDKGKGLPPALQAQWEKDREKKAERKLAREIARLEAAGDPLAKKKGGKKGRKAMVAAARADPKITVIGPNRVIDMTTLVQQIRRFLANQGGPQTMSLPPCNKYTRKLVHEMAAAFHLKSKSNGGGDARYTTLMKTSRSGLQIDEKKVAKLVRQGGFSNGSGEWSGRENGKGKGNADVSGLRQKEGDEVGKAAPKINSSNIGFKMLEAMGWSEGNRIGVTGGLEQPLTAIIKRSKLGLGATRAQ